MDVTMTPMIRRYAERLDAIAAALGNGETWAGIAARMGSRGVQAAKGSYWTARRAIRNGQISPAQQPLPDPPPEPKKEITLEAMQTDLTRNRACRVRVWVCENLTALATATKNGWSWDEIAIAIGLTVEHGADLLRAGFHDEVQSRIKARQARNLRIVAEYRAACETFGSEHLPPDLLGRLDFGG